MSENADTDSCISSNINPSNFHFPISISRENSPCSQDNLMAYYNKTWHTSKAARSETTLQVTVTFTNLPILMPYLKASVSFLGPKCNTAKLKGVGSSFPSQIK